MAGDQVHIRLGRSATGTLMPTRGRDGLRREMYDLLPIENWEEEIPVPDEELVEERPEI